LRELSNISTQKISRSGVAEVFLAAKAAQSIWRKRFGNPDRNAVAVKWWQHSDAGTYPGTITFSRPTALKTTFSVPDDAEPGQTINIVLEAIDDGTPHLTRYQRIVVIVE
jgi:hypothetical protein